MAKRSTSSAPSAPTLFDDDRGFITKGANTDDVATRRELFLRHAEAASQVATYVFKLPPGALARTLGDPAVLRDARDQLHAVVSMTGGALGKFPDGLSVRVPLVVAERFEALARSLIEDFLVAYDRASANPSPTDG